MSKKSHDKDIKKVINLIRTPRNQTSINQTIPINKIVIKIIKEQINEKKILTDKEIHTQTK